MEPEEIFIHDYTIRRLDDGSFWITNELQEGMQISENKLGEWLDRIWREEF